MQRVESVFLGTAFATVQQGLAEGAQFLAVVDQGGVLVAYFLVDDRQKAELAVFRWVTPVSAIPDTPDLAYLGYVVRYEMPYLLFREVIS